MQVRLRTGARLRLFCCQNVGLAIAASKIWRWVLTCGASFGIAIRSLSAEVEGLFEARDPVRVLPPFSWFVIGGLILMLFVLITLAIIDRRRRRLLTPPPPPDPYVIAVAELDAAKRSIHVGAEEPFIVEVSNIIRRYIERELELPSSGRTTEEFLPFAATHPLLQGELSASLSSFLNQCDLVKFARATISVPAMEDLLGVARAFVDETHRRNRSAETSTAVTTS